MLEREVGSMVEAAARRIHVTGASGAGVTTLGRALADHLAIPHADTDDYFWLPTDPPYVERRAIDERMRLMRELFLPRRAWVLSGSLDGWGDALMPMFDLVVLVITPTAERLARLQAREGRRYGASAVAPGGARHAEVATFIEWASHYDDGTRVSRNRVRHELWLAKQECPVVRLDGTRPAADLVAEVLAVCRAAGDR